MRRLVEDAGLADRIEVDSAGTAAYHTGEPADERSAATARARGVALTSVARPFTPGDFARFDYVIAMDRENQANLLDSAPSDEAAARVALLRSYDPDSQGDPDVPDPYYGGPNGFDRVFEICESGCAALLAYIRETHRI